MKLIFGTGSRLYVWETSLAKANVVNGQDGEAEMPEAGENPPVDPHGTLHVMAEISPHAVDEGARDPRRFGFYGSADD